MLTLPPLSNQHINTLYVKHKLFDDEQITNILKDTKIELWRSAEAVDPNTGQSVKSKDRVCQGQAVSNNFPLNNLLHVITQMNSQYWRFDINHVDLVRDYPSVYKYGVDGHFDWHVDMSTAISTRKLGFTIQLSNPKDYEGGDLQFFDGSKTRKEPELKEKGTLIVFPSFVWHRVLPITKGTRYAIVGWIHGNHFK